MNKKLEYEIPLLQELLVMDSVVKGDSFGIDEELNINLRENDPYKDYDEEFDEEEDIH